MTDRPRALVVLIAVFLLGGIIGSAGSYFWLRNRQAEEIRAVPNGGFPSRQGGQVRMRFPDLQLTPEQEDQFREIMVESRMKLDAVRRESEPEWQRLMHQQEPKIEAIFAETERKLNNILNEEQRKKWAEFIGERGNWRRWPPRGGRGMEPPASQHEPQRPGATNSRINP